MPTVHEVGAAPMKTADGFCSKCLWIALTLIFALDAIGGAVKVPWGNDSVPLSVVLNGIDWPTAARFYRYDEFSVFALAGCLAALYGLTRTWRLRLGFVLAGFMCPLLIFDTKTTVTALVVSPFLLLGALSGRADGEFYAEGMLQITAVGLWMLLCVFFAGYEVYRSQIAAPNAAPSGGPAAPLGNSDPHP